MSEVDKCVCCGEVIPEGAQACSKCLISLEPPTKFAPGQLVKFKLEKEVRYNHVVDSYFNTEVNMQMYRLNECMAMPIYREDWLEAVTEDEVVEIVKSGKLKIHPNGGWTYPIEEVTE